MLLLGATGTIGRATCDALLARGHQVVALVRPGSVAELPQGTVRRHVDVSDPVAVARDGFGAALPDDASAPRFDAVVSCMASRSGEPRDAWEVDHRAHMNVLHAAKAAGVRQFVLLSAICVQKPRLPFQQAKLAFERALRESGLVWSIVRPTAFFKSLSGQIERVRAGRSFLVFGDGRLTACKPISDRDLADFIVGCLDDPARQNATLPIGGPGPALTPLEQGGLLFDALGQAPRIRHVPVALVGGIAATLGVLGVVSGRLRAKAELARIGHYYATESMLLLDPATGRYDAAATPEHGQDTLADHYAQLIRDGTSVDLGAHSVF